MYNVAFKKKKIYIEFWYFDFSILSAAPIGKNCIETAILSFFVLKFKQCVAVKALIPYPTGAR